MFFSAMAIVSPAAEKSADIRASASATRHKNLEMPRRRYPQLADKLRTFPRNLDGVELE